MSFWNLPSDNSLDRDPQDGWRYPSPAAPPTCQRCGVELVNPTPVQTHCAACIATIVAEAKRDDAAR